MYMFTGTSFGNVGPATPPSGGWPQKTIFRALNDAGVSWRYYYQDADIYLADFADYYRPEIKPKVYKIDNWFSVLASATADRDLPQVVFIERAGSTGLDEHPDNNIQRGAASVQKIVSALMNSAAWQSSVFILSYDEGGGLYDHVPPFQVAEPDAIAPILKSGDVKARFNLSGFRVRFKSRGGIDGVANRRVFGTAFGADVTNDRLARVQANADADFRIPFGAQFVIDAQHAPLHRNCG